MSTIERDAAHLLCPDGYVALAKEEQDGARLGAFAGKRGLRFANA